jgi:hypothetical protein
VSAPGAGSAVEVAQQADLSAVVHHLTVDVQDQTGHGVRAELGALGSQRCLQGRVVERGDPVVPPPVRLLKEGEAFGGAAGQDSGYMARIEHGP